MEAWNLEGMRPDGHEFWGLPNAIQLLRGGNADWVSSDPGVHAWTPEYADVYLAEGHSSLKNYHGEVEAFFDWLAPHVTSSGFLGYSLYEESELPVLYVVKDGRLTAIDALRARALPLMDYSGGWRRPDGDER